jgi:hypothetical protein
MRCNFEAFTAVQADWHRRSSLYGRKRLYFSLVDIASRMIGCDEPQYRECPAGICIYVMVAAVKRSYPSRRGLQTSLGAFEPECRPDRRERPHKRSMSCSVCRGDGVMRKGSVPRMQAIRWDSPMTGGL